MNRRRFLRGAAALPWLLRLRSPRRAPAWAESPAAHAAAARVRPGDPAWPSATSWDRLNREVGGRLRTVPSPVDVCQAGPHSASCRDLFTALRNPYAISDHVGLTQTSGWVDGWTSTPSVYAVAARTTADVVAAVNFARDHHLRLVVKGGGHSDQGTSNAADSLLIWTRAMQTITLHDAFVGQGCAGTQGPHPAVTVEAGALWLGCDRSAALNCHLSVAL